jgi:hypothetical protein
MSAKAEAAARVGLGGTKKFVAVQVLAAQHAVNVAHRHLDLAGIRAPHRGYGRVFRHLFVF